MLGVTDSVQKEAKISLPEYSLCEELLNSISHGVGALASVAGLVLCVCKGASLHDPWKVVSGAIFGATMVILYTMSCLYHALKRNKAKRVFRVMDHCTIFFLIAGTYTPFTLVALRGTLGWVIFGVIWAMAALGIVLNAVNLKKFAKLSVVCYLIMGWMIVLAFKPMCQVMESKGIALLIWGGVAYSIGALLYAIGSRRKYFHSIFHFCCLIGTLLHFLSIYLYVL